MLNYQRVSVVIPLPSNSLTMFDPSNLSLSNPIIFPMKIAMHWAYPHPNKYMLYIYIYCWLHIP